MTRYRERLEAGEFAAPASGEPQTQQTPAGEGSPLDGMSKQDLLDKAVELGATPANHSMNKDELKAAIIAAGGG
jgi:hypothetical protein